VQWIDLGLNPMVLDETSRPHENGFAGTLFHLSYRYNRHCNFQGLHFTKSRFGGQWTPILIVIENGFPKVTWAAWRG
jgi:lysylphosphatidylglycerol synthetase-like protein (DUF2156 family)